jgi:mediator of RNA polymerase II transcription subunit 16
VVCIAYADGTVEYRDRITMEETYNEITLDRVTTLNQVGFTFAEETPCEATPPIPPHRHWIKCLTARSGVSMAFSPTHCSIAQICADGKVRWNGLRYPLGDIGNSNQDGMLKAQAPIYSLCVY